MFRSRNSSLSTLCARLTASSYDAASPSGGVAESVHATLRPGRLETGAKKLARHRRGDQWPERARVGVCRQERSVLAAAAEALAGAVASRRPSAPSARRALELK